MSETKKESKPLTEEERKARMEKLLAERAAMPSTVSDGDWYFARPDKDGVWCDGDGDPLP